MEKDEDLIEEIEELEKESERIEMEMLSLF